MASMSYSSESESFEDSFSSSSEPAPRRAPPDVQRSPIVGVQASPARRGIHQPEAIEGVDLDGLDSSTSSDNERDDILLEVPPPVITVIPDDDVRMLPANERANLDVLLLHTAERRLTVDAGSPQRLVSAARRGTLGSCCAPSEDPTEVKVLILRVLVAVEEAVCSFYRTQIELAVRGAIRAGRRERERDYDDSEWESSEVPAPASPPQPTLETSLPEFLPGLSSPLLTDLLLRRLAILPPTQFDRGTIPARLCGILSPQLVQARLLIDLLETRIKTVPRDRVTERLQLYRRLDQAQFDAAVAEARLALQLGVLPALISKGTSGSYFLRDRRGHIMAVYKPGDEEPYGDNNPKFTKKFQRYVLPCTFGRKCLLNQQGYLAESCASLVDRALNFFVVPHTEVVEIASLVFHYSSDVMRTVNRGRGLLPPKAGSFQMFLNGYRNASEMLPRLEKSPLPADLSAEFQENFEKMVVLDYIIRNTDRGPDNWMIKYDEFQAALSPPPSRHDHPSERRISIAAIDNGLAFPIMHPSGLRKFPFIWKDLPQAHVPFSRALRTHLERYLKNRTFLVRLVADLHSIMSSTVLYDQDCFDAQIGVLIGQVTNVITVIDTPGSTPADLAAMPTLMPAVQELINEAREMPAHATEAAVLVPEFDASQTGVSMPCSPQVAATAGAEPAAAAAAAAAASVSVPPLLLDPNSGAEGANTLGVRVSNKAAAAATAAALSGGIGDDDNAAGVGAPLKRATPPLDTPPRGVSGTTTYGTMATA